MQKKNDIYIPAEFSKHKATWIAWPFNKNDWPGKFTPINWVYTEIARYLSKSEQLNIIVQDENHKKRITNSLSKSGVNLSAISFHLKKTDRSWLRDSMPQFVKNKKNNLTELVHFKFNGWAKYDNWKNDSKIPGFVAKKTGFNLTVALSNENEHIVLEGGAIDYNGFGTVLTTRECLLDPNVQTRNKGFSEKDYLNYFNKYLGIDRIIWLNKGIAGDDTHGHVDDICRFIGQDKFLLVQEDNPKDDNYIPLNENREILQGLNADVIYLPMPSPVIFDGQRLPASYANFYIANSVVLVPTFNDPNDRIALGIISELFPEREIIGIHSTDLVWGLGTLHCLTHEEPE